MRALNGFGKTALTGVVILGSMVATLNVAQAESCLQVRGPKQARVLSSNCSSETGVPITPENNQQSPLVETPVPHDADHLSPEQSTADHLSPEPSNGIGGAEDSSIQQEAKPKVLFRGPKRGGYIAD